MQAPFEFDYIASRAAFRELAIERGAELQVLKLLGSGVGEDLTIDVARFGSPSAAKKVVVMAGTHGVEAPVGALLHQSLLRDPLHCPSDTTTIFIHCVNPWGMKYGRRTNASNVDLNRNAIILDSERTGAPEGYDLVRDLLLPRTDVNYWTFCARASWRIYRHGFATIKQAVTGGQYVDPEGIFYGGAALQEELQVLRSYFETTLSESRRVVVVDIHSGLGRYGTDALLLDFKEGSPQFLRAQDLFSGEHLQGADPYNSIAYHTKGSIGNIIIQSFPGVDVEYVCHEFGTRNPLTVLHALVYENYLAKLPHRDDFTEARRKKILREAFCPDDKVWREKVIIPRGRAVFEKALGL